MRSENFRMINQIRSKSLVSSIQWPVNACGDPVRRPSDLWLLREIPGEPRGVAGHQIDFEIDFVAKTPFAPGRDAQRMRNEQHRKNIAVDAVDRQRRAIERDGTFF